MSMTATMRAQLHQLLATVPKVERRVATQMRRNLFARADYLLHSPDLLLMSGAWRFPKEVICPPLPASYNSPLLRVLINRVERPRDVVQLLRWQREWLSTKSFAFGVSRQLYGTTVYHYPYATPLKGFPEISSDGRAIIFALGGCGTMQSTGRNFMRYANALRQYGLSIVSPDYPFHANGPRDERYRNIEWTKGMLFKLIKHYKSSGLPVYLVGHSLGPLFIQELLHDSPKLVQGAIMFSPGTLSAELLKYYRYQKATGVLDVIDGQELDLSDEALEWEEAIVRGAQTLHADIIPADVPVAMFAGNQDPFSTPQLLSSLAEKYPNANLEILWGKGHRFFEGGGEDLMLRKMFETIGKYEGDLPRQRARARHPFSIIRYYSENSEMFRHWFGNTETRPLSLFLNNEHAANDLLERWDNVYRAVLVGFARYLDPPSPYGDLARMNPGDLNHDQLGMLGAFVKRFAEFANI